MRVQRLKRLLLFGPYIVFLVVLALVIVLSVFVVLQNRRIGALEEEIGHLTMNQNSLIEKVSSVDSSVDELKSAVTAISNELSLVDISAYDRQDKGSARTAWPKKVYLTFDDGPSPNTSKILDILDEYDVRASFL